MPRKLRVPYPGAIYHVMNRGDRGDAIFVNDVDRHDFLKTLAEACEKTGWQVQAYCLLRNHFHLVVETPNANLVDGMKWLLSAYTIRLNHRHKRFGHVFSGRYKALLVEEAGPGDSAAPGNHADRQEHRRPLKPGHGPKCHRASAGMEPANGGQTQVERTHRPMTLRSRSICAGLNHFPAVDSPTSVSEVAFASLKWGGTPETSVLPPLRSRPTVAPLTFRRIST
jgi:REP element-mobilizing transposase RayT